MRKSQYKTGDRVVVKNHPDIEPDLHNLEGVIVGWVPKGPRDAWLGNHAARRNDGEHFLVWLDNPPDRVKYRFSYYNGNPAQAPYHHGIYVDEDVEPASPDPTIGEIADLFGVDPADIAQAALDEVEAEMKIERILRGNAHE